MRKRLVVHTTDGKEIRSKLYTEADETDGIEFLLETTEEGCRFRDLDIIFMNGEHPNYQHAIAREHIVRIDIIEDRV